jgi:hypothetical protein
VVAAQLHRELTNLMALKSSASPIRRNASSRSPGSAIAASQKAFSKQLRTIVRASTTRPSCNNIGTALRCVSDLQNRVAAMIFGSAAPLSVTNSFGFAACSNA